MCTTPKSVFVTVRRCLHPFPTPRSRESPRVPHSRSFTPHQAVFSAVAATSSAANGSPARGWDLSPFTGVTTCAPVPVVLQPATDNSTYSVSMYGDSSVANSLNAYVKDGQVWVENTAPFNTANGVGVVITMPPGQLASITNKGLGGSASLTAVSGFTPATLTVDTVAGSGPTVLGINNSTSAMFVSHASSSNMTVAGEIGTVNFSTGSGASGTASFNAVATGANLLVASATQSVYVGGLTDVTVQGSSLGQVTVSNGTCSLSSGTCTTVPPLAVQNVTMPVFTGASVAQICSCSGGCQNPPPPPPPRPSPQPSPKPPSPSPRPTGQDCSSTGPNCKACCERKLNSWGGAAYYQDSSCWPFPTSNCNVSPSPTPSPTPPPPTPSPVGTRCSSTGPSNCQECCANKYQTSNQEYYADPSCTNPRSNCYYSPFATPPNGFLGGRKLMDA